MTFWWIWTLGMLGLMLWSSRCSLKTLSQSLSLIVVVCIVRWVFTPMDNYVVLGHTNQYLSVFKGEVPDFGDTSAYPMMQIIWWMLGKVSPSSMSSYIWSILAGSVSVVLLGRHQQQWHLAVMGWFALWPLHWFWSFSGYNVIWPFLFLTIATQMFQEGRWLGLMAAFSLAIGCRVESVMLWPLFWCVAWKMDASLSWRHILSATVFSMIPIMGMLQFPIPGEGDIQLSWSLNWDFVGLYRDLGFSVLVLIFTGIFLGKRSRYLMVFTLLVFFHLSMIGFNDWSSRHLLPLGLLVYWLWNWLETEKILGRRIVGALLVLNNIVALGRELQTFYASPEAFEAHFSDKETVDASVGECAWVVEEETFVLENRPVLSHFNLLSPDEVQEYVERYGCIQWCQTYQDWRWTELDIRDRASRLKHLHLWKVDGWFRRDDNACLVYQLVLP